MAEIGNDVPEFSRFRGNFTSWPHNNLVSRETFYQSASVNCNPRFDHRRRVRSRSAVTRPFLRISVTESSILGPLAAASSSCSRLEKAALFVLSN